MNIADLAANLLTPPILLFALGLAAAWLRSDLEIPAPAAKTLSLFLLFAIGLKGGVSLAEGGAGPEVLSSMGAALLGSLIVPLWVFFALRTRFGSADAAGLAAAYGSVSAVTFITATGFLAQRGEAYSGHMVAALALMESPAIILGVALARRGTAAGANWKHLGRDAVLNGSVFLLLGSLLVGVLCGPARAEPLKPFINTLFPGLLAMFLLDMGLAAAKRVRDLRAVGRPALVFGLVAPPVNAALGLGLAVLFGLSPADGFLLIVLVASASYIAVPAALRMALPEANPGIYVTLSLAVTFPFNILVGLPIYYQLATSCLGQ